MGTVQKDWRCCVKCNVMFFDGYDDKGACPSDGRGHDRGDNGLAFVLTHDVAGDNHTQGSWRFCHKCAAMFFDGYPTKGKCDRDLAGHEAAGFVFVLPHDYPESPTQQSQWRFCNKCFGLFFDGEANKGHCAAGEGHVSEGLVFALPHLAPGAVTIDTNA